MTGRFAGVRTVMGMAVIVAAGGIALSAGAAVSLDAQQNDATDQLLDRQARQAQEAVSAESGRYVDALRSIAAAAGTIDDLTAERFDAVAAPLASMRLAGATSVAFMVPATESQAPAIQGFWRSRGATGLVLTPKGTAAEHIFSVFSTTLDGSSVAGIGIDVSQASAPTAALNEARRSGRPTVSDTYQLLRDAHLPAAQRQMSFVLTAPVYSPDSRTFRGWVLMGLRGQDFASATLMRVSQQLMDITMRAMNSNQEQVPVATLTAPVDGNRDLSRELEIPVADRRWKLHLTARRDSLPGAENHLPMMVGAGGTALSLMMAVLVFVLATGRRRADAQVLAATAELAAHAGALRETRDDLAGQQAYLTQVLDALEPTVLTCDTDGVIVHANRSARNAAPPVDGPVSVVERAAARGFRHPDGAALTPGELPLLRSLDGEHVDRMEVVADGPDGTPQVLLIHSRPLLQPGGQITGAVATVYDITELREREKELRAFAGVVAHDLRSPLTAIAGYAEILDDGLTDQLPAARLRPALGRVRSGVDRMRTLIEDLLAYATARDAALDQQPVDLAEVVSEVLIERTAHLRDPGAGGLFPDIYTGPLPVVHADPGMIRQLVDNLVGNALKYTAPGQPARVDISANRRPGDDLWTITIADRGIGIPAEDQPHIFASFHRAAAHSTYQGTGLGLAICERIVTRHGGTIAATGNPGGGTRFRFTLPPAHSDADDIRMPRTDVSDQELHA